MNLLPATSAYGTARRTPKGSLEPFNYVWPVETAPMPANLDRALG